MTTPTQRKKANKYGAKPTIVDGIRFASRLEAARYRELKARVEAGVIRNLQRQVSYSVDWPGVKNKKDAHLFTYVADFVYETDAGSVVEDVKGKILGPFRMKARGVKCAHGIDVVVVTRKRSTWYFGGKPELRRYHEST